MILHEKAIFGAIAVAAALMVLFAACGNDPQDVNLAGPKAPQVSKVVFKTVATGYVSVSWDGVESTSASYNVVFQLKGNKTLFSGTSASPDYTNTVSGDTFTRFFTTSPTSSTISPSVALITGKEYRAGVYNSDERYSASSDIVWSDYISAP